MIEVVQLSGDRVRPDPSPPGPSFTAQARQYLQDSFDSLLAQDPELSGVVLRMQSEGMLGVVFGGWARDRLFEHMLRRECPSRDIDFVAWGKASVATVFPPEAVRNPFGGVGIGGSRIHIDAWDLPNTFLIRRNSLRVEFDQLPATADYNVNAVVFRPAQFFGVPGLLDGGAANAFASGQLDFMADEVAQPRVQAARALILSARFDLTLSDTVRSFVKYVCKTSDSIEAVKGGLADYCPPQFLSRANGILQSLIEQ